MFKQERLLIKIAEMYYLENKTQSQISKELGIHRSTISRLLKQTRESGIVEINIKYDTAGNYSIEKVLEKSFGLQKAIVVSTGNNISKKQKNILLAQALGSYIETLLLDNMKVGFSWGETLSTVVQYLPSMNLPNTICVPMIGGPSGTLPSEFHVNTITYQASQRLHSNSLLIDCPAIPQSKLLKEELLNNNLGKLIYTHKYFERFALSDVDKFDITLNQILERTDGIWSKEAEGYILERYTNI